MICGVCGQVPGPNRTDEVHFPQTAFLNRERTSGTFLAWKSISAVSVKKVLTVRDRTWACLRTRHAGTLHEATRKRSTCSVTLSAFDAPCTQPFPYTSWTCCWISERRFQLASASDLRRDHSDRNLRKLRSSQ